MESNTNYEIWSDGGQFLIFFQGKLYFFSVWAWAGRICRNPGNFLFAFLLMLVFLNVESGVEFFSRIPGLIFNPFHVIL